MTELCRDCGRLVLRCLSLRGKRQLLDERPDYVRGVYFIAAADGDGGTRLAIHISHLADEAKDHAQRQGLRLYRSHYATCAHKRQRVAA